MDKITKFLKKLTKEEREKVAEIIHLLLFWKFKALDVKKLTNQENIFRVRMGKVRIIFYMYEKDLYIVAISQRSEKTYRNL